MPSWSSAFPGEGSLSDTELVLGVPGLNLCASVPLCEDKPRAKLFGLPAQSLSLGGDYSPFSPGGDHSPQKHLRRISGKAKAAN